MKSKPLKQEIAEFEDDSGPIVIEADFETVERQVLETLIDNLTIDTNYYVRY